MFLDWQLAALFLIPWYVFFFPLLDLGYDPDVDSQKFILIFALIYGVI